MTDSNVPIIKEAFANLVCKKQQVVDAGDHYILIGEVIDIEKNDHEPMLYYRRKIGAVPNHFGE